MVEKLSDGSYRIETSTGDILIFMASEVKQVKNIYNKTQKSAGTTNKDDHVIRRGNKLCFSGSGMALTEDAFRDIASWQKYQKESKAGRNARITLYSGLGAFAVGDAFIFGILVQGYPTIQHIDYAELFLYSGIIIGCAGLITAIIGAIGTNKSNIKLNVMAKTFSQTPGYVLNFGAQQHGIGLALNF